MKTKIQIIWFQFKIQALYLSFFSNVEKNQKWIEHVMNDTNNFEALV